MTWLRLGLLAAALGLGGAITALILTRPATDSPSRIATLGLVIGLAWSLTGLEEWRRRPQNRIGPLMVLLGFAWYASGLENVAVSALFTIGLIFAGLWYAVFAHVLLAFPTGRLESRLTRTIVTLAYVDAFLVVAVSVLFNGVESPFAENLAVVWWEPGIADALKRAAQLGGVVLILVSLGILAYRWRKGTRPWRRAVAPVLVSGAVAVAAGALSLLLEGLGLEHETAETCFLIALAIVPFGFKLGLVRDRLARGAIADLVVRLGETTAPGELRDALARALDDPSLALAYWLPEQQRYVDVDGRPVTLPEPDSGRVATIVERNGRRIAALVHDASLEYRDGLVDAVGAAAGLALENERLQAELRARLDELRAASARIVEAADAERRRIERNLHDGTQQRLVSVSMALGLAESRLASDPEGARRILAEAREGLAVALQELRELSQGIHPGILTERGLGAAVEELALRAPLPVDVEVPSEERLPEPVEAAAYYVVAEALANVAKYASASAAKVTVARRNGRAVVEVADDGVGGADPAGGSGLAGLADRVGALGGELVLESEPGKGTRVVAEIPCAS